jgi:hypothetical protein
VAWTQGRLGVPIDVERWLDPLDPMRRGSSLYQTANRLAYTVWFRRVGVDAWLCHLLFIDDALYRPTNRTTWEQGLEEAERALGIAGLDFPYAGHAFLDALSPEEQLSDLHPARAGS